MAVPSSLDKHLQFKKAEEFLRARYFPLFDFVKARDKYVTTNLPGNLVEKKWGAEGLDHVFGDLQKTLQALVSASNDTTTIGSQAHSKPLIWVQEKHRLQNLYAYLKSSPAAFNLCEALCSAVDARTSLLVGEFEKMGLILKTREQIGKIIFLFDEDPKFFDKINKEPNKAITEIEAQIPLLFINFYDNMFGSCKGPEHLNLQEHGHVLRNEKLKLAAKCLINSQGQLNLGLINSIKLLFFPDFPKEPYVDNFFFALDSMDHYWQEHLDAIKLPLKTYVNDVVCADQGLKSDQLSVRVVRQEVLYAVLCQMSYGGSVNSYAASWAIKKPQECIARMFEDYRSLLQEGFLTRMENGSPEHFFFKKTNADRSGNTLTLGEDGLVLQYTNFKNESVCPSLSFDECPHLLNAAWMMGIDLKARKNDVLTALFSAPYDPQAQPSKIFKWDELIEAIASLDAPGPRLLEERKYLGLYAFSLSTCRLLQARESALAAMWENRVGDSIQKKVETTIMAVFKETFDRYQLGVPVYQKVLIEELKRLFVRTLQESSRYIYNAHTGSFDLYRRDVTDLSKRGSRISTSDDFRKFVFEVIEKTERVALNKTKDSFRDRGAIHAVIEGMRATVFESDFMGTVLRDHDSINIKTSDLLVDYSKSLRTPMSHKADRSFLEIDPGVDFIPDTRSVLPNDPRELLKWMLNLTRWKITIGALQHKPSIRQMFNIELANEEFQHFTKGILSPDAWIEEMLIKPGRAVSESMMEEQTKTLFRQSVEAFNARTFHKIPASVLIELDELFKGMRNQRMTVSQYCQRVSDGLASIFRLGDEQKHLFSFVLDSILFRQLPPQQNSVILNGAVRFAKIKGKVREHREVRKSPAEGKEKYFCFYFSPISQQLRLGRLSSDRKILKPMDEYSWLFPPDWYAYPDPINELISKLMAAD